MVDNRWFRLMTSCFAGVLLCGPAHAEEFSQRITGDIGLGGYYTRSIISDKRDALSVLPYADFSYGRLFARVDTLGVKTSALGYGHLELVGRISTDGYNTDTPRLQGLSKRETPLPLGIGTLQETPVGGLMVNAFHDVNRSQGNLVEAIYGGEFDLPDVTFYPLLGAEYQSAAYARYYYGISAQEAAGSRYTRYEPAGVINRFLGLMFDVGLTEEYHLNGYVRRKWLGDAIQRSPLVTLGYQDTAYLALSYRFK